MTRYSKTALALALGVALAVPCAWAQKAPQPKSNKEIQALQAVQNAKTPDEQLKAIDSVLENFADTEYKTMLLQMGMQVAENKGDYAATVTYAERLLDADPKNIFALTTLAIQTAMHTREFDLDKDEKLAKVDKYANDALNYAKDAPKIRPDLTDEQWTKIKADIMAQDHDALGRAALLRKKYDVAVNEFQTAMSTAATPDPTYNVRLGEAYLQSGKFDDAAAQFDKAIAMPDTPAQVKQIATQRKADALRMKAAGAKPAPPANTGPATVPIKP